MLPSLANVEVYEMPGVGELDERNVLLGRHATAYWTSDATASKDKTLVVLNEQVRSQFGFRSGPVRVLNALNRVPLSHIWIDEYGIDVDNRL
jgi:hypothetical protein